jgi:hypothetical protein
MMLMRGCNDDDFECTASDRKARQNCQLHTYAYRLAVDFLAAVGAVLGGGDPVFLELLVDELRGAAAVAPIHV